MTREGFGDEIFERQEFQEKVKEVYEKELLNESWNIINGNQTLEQITNDIHKVAEAKIHDFFPHLLDKSIKAEQIEIQKLFID